MKRFLSRHWTGVLSAIPVACFAMLLAGCMDSLLAPVAPSLETTVSLPLTDRTWYVSDFASSDTSLILNADNSYSYVTTQSTDPRQIDSLAATPSATENYVELGSFSLLGIEDTMMYSVVDMGLPTGIPYQIPAGNVSLPSSRIIDTTQFDYVAVNSARLLLTIKNTLPVPIDFPNPLILTNDWISPLDNALIAQFSLATTIAPGGSLGPIPCDLSGKLLRGMIKSNPFTVHTPGSASPVTLTASQGVSLIFSLIKSDGNSGIEADSAYANIPYQKIHPSSDSLFTVDSALVLKDAEFRSGKFTVAVRSNIDLTTESLVSIPELQTSSASGFSASRDMNGIDSLRFSVSIDSLKIVRTGVLPDKGTSLKYSVGIRIVNSNNAKKFVSKHQRVTAQLIPDGALKLLKVTGKITPQNLVLNSAGKPDYHLGDAQDQSSAALAIANMKLHLHLAFSKNPGEVPPPFDYKNLSLVAVNSKYHQRDSLRLVLDGRVDPGQTTSIDLSALPNFTHFVNFFGSHFPDLPDSCFVRGQIVVSPDGVGNPSSTYYTIYDTSKVYPSFDLEVPMFGIADGHIDEMGRNGAKDNSDMRSVVDGTLNCMFQNRIPMGMSFRMSFVIYDSVGRARTLVTLPHADTIKVNAAPIAGGMASGALVSSVPIHLTTDDIGALNQADSISVRFNMSTTNNGNLVRICCGDYIRFRSSATIRYVVNKP